ncbi:ATP phosphoribosyltransferase [Kocuria palustris]|mgnify:FL=1|jgi:ATP phosphoribosyltransferase|uniref:ATP phosphoribosyltransferase n=1 Tax=Kocuria palustris TaxID=71999 RepID=UPI0019D02B88|nr:ATP phosphoribosyltransferase [Kocuria palustris]MBN6752495.1 ATP phosphoribosyltransferase [Kocuria palustris]MBN6757450.1 ATP phosphoribosyltransferase [Kocuria palustris]MBN6762478.1 ATP phosphoribosyltransferase [Kocuria palustris]MBN6781960.1 ATP phosphoribosyltransferase [Kocuria palustris]MBN6798444.1 ATP phosphoribosyltransferase [Kocuria palustris]
MLRVAVPNKGALSESAAAMLSEAGYRQRRDSRELVLVDPENHVEFFYLRPRDIAVYVGGGVLDVGITGRDLLLDSEADAVEDLGLDFARSTFRFAGPAGQFSSMQDLEGRRVATSYDSLLRRHLAKQGVQAEVVRLDGAVESSIRLGVADAIADVVETGNTLRAAGLEIFGEPIMRSEALLIRNAAKAEAEGLEVLRRRIQGVLVARQYVMIDYDITEDLLEAATAVTPGMEGPTISPLGHHGAMAVRAMVRRSDTNKVMDELYAVGARAILVSPIHAARL